jgi:hypothetical protein
MSGDGLFVAFSLNQTSAMQLKIDCQQRGCDISLLCSNISSWLRAKRQPFALIACYAVHFAKGGKAAQAK